jgi:hypothetical protein
MPPRKRAPLRVVPDLPTEEPAEEREPTLAEALAELRANRKGHKQPEPVPGLDPPKTKVHARQAQRMQAQGIIDKAPRPEPKQVDPERSKRGKLLRAAYMERRRAEGAVEIQTWHELDDEGNATGRTEERERLILPPADRRCRATVRRGEWAGNRCSAYAIRGGTVCKVHGGNTIYAKKAAQTRLSMAADPAAAELIRIALVKKGVADADRIRAINSILDRAGVAGAQTIEVDIKPWQAILQRVAGQIPGATGENVLELEEGVDYTVEDDSADVDDDA